MKRLAIMMIWLFLLLPIAAQENTTVFEIYDPLIPQLFAFDMKNGVFAGINNVDNKIVLVSKQENDLYITYDFQVDRVSGRHDVHHIYRPKSVAIYEDHVVFLASHRDSCYLAVLDLNGKLVRKLVFLGAADAFSYSPTYQELYISGENPTGFDVIALDTSQGMSQIDLKNAAALHYQKPRLSEKIALRDPSGIGMAAIAISVVFSALLFLYVIFKQVGLRLIAIQDRRTHQHKLKKQEAKPETVSSSRDVSGGVYAAITAAIYLYSEELHDVESAVLTINKVSRTYSPWSSKIHGLNTYFKR